MANVDIEYFYDTINEVWKYIKSHKVVGTSTEEWTCLWNEMQTIIAESDPVKLKMYSAAYALMQKAACEEIEKNKKITNL